MKYRPVPTTLTMLLTAVAVVCISSHALASVIPGIPLAPRGPMPWDAVLGTVGAALTGTTAKLLALIGIAVCGTLYITGEGHGGRLIKVGLGISLLVGAGNLVNLFFQGGTGAVV